MPRRSSLNWPYLIQEWKKSGLSKVAFCREKGISKDSFYKWQKALDKQPDLTPDSTPIKFIEIETPNAAHKDLSDLRCLRIVTSYGTILEIPL
jgi:hypothetical protein